MNAVLTVLRYGGTFDDKSAFESKNLYICTEVNIVEVLIQI
jgi:hypothetical protein